MTSNETWIIFWENYAKNSYIYGTTLKFLHNKKVYYKNLMANTGIVIKKWESQYNFQASRSSLELPLLNKGKLYEIIIDADVFPKDSLYLRINFYDIYSELIEYQIIQNMKGEFKVPYETHRYNIEIFSAGLKEMTFSNLTIKEYNYTDDKDKCENNVVIDEINKDNNNLNLINIDNQRKIINIIFQEKSINAMSKIDEGIISLFNNVLVINNNYIENLNNKDELIRILGRFLIDYSTYNINFIGYGETSNKIAIYCATLFGGKAILSDIAINISKYSMEDYEDFSNDFIKLYNNSSLTLVEDNLATINDEISKKLFCFDYRLKLISKEVI